MEAWNQSILFYATIFIHFKAECIVTIGGRFSLPEIVDENGDILYVNPVVVAIEFLAHVVSCYPEYLNMLQPANELDRLCARELHQRLGKIQNEYEYVEDTLVDEDCEGSEDNNSCEWIDDEGNIVENESLRIDYVSLDQKKKILDKINANPGKKLKWLHRHGCSKLKHFYYKKVWEHQVAVGGTRFDKLKAIDEFVWDKFKEARKELRSIHGHDLRRWAVQKSREFPQPSTFIFTAGYTWVESFKRRHKISSRKICKLVNKRDVVDAEALQNRSQAYREKMRESIQNYHPDQVINWDQSGCQYEIASSRTLTFKGEDVTFGFARSPTNRVTHSYTVQHTISLSGKVIGPAYVCLQEPGGRLGPRVQETMFKAHNILLTCSHSGKLTTSLHEYYLDQELVPHVENLQKEFLLTFDQWRGQVDAFIYATRFGVNGVPECEIHMIPERCTPYCQPLDTVYNRQFKYLLRRITGQVQLEQEDTDASPIHSRNNILKLQSLVHFQLSARIFRPMVRYAWYKAGITEEKEAFQNVKEVCFTFQYEKSTHCDKSNCQQPIFIRCSRCRIFLCFTHFYHSYHSPGEECDDEDSQTEDEV